MTFADHVLDWLLRQRDRAVALGDTDLVLVREHPSLADTSARPTLRGEAWEVVHVSGELTLRAALPEAGRLVAIVPITFVAPADLAGRAWFGRPIDVSARDLVAAAAQRPCDPLLDDALSQAVEAGWTELRDRAVGWSADGAVSVREVRDVLLAARLGTGARLDRVRPDELLARWMMTGAPREEAALLGRGLADAHGREGRWLAWAIGQADGLETLVTAGALAGGDLPTDLTHRVPGIEAPADRLALGRLVEAAVRAVWQDSPQRASTWLASAEGRAADVAPEVAERFTLLRTPLVSAIRSHLAEAAGGTAASDARIEGLMGNVHAAALREDIALVRVAARLARFIAASPTAVEGDWFAMARDHVAWGDLALREARRRRAGASDELARLADEVIARYVMHRDAMNAAFASWLARSWVGVSAQKDRRRALPVHQISRCLVRPLLDAGHRVLWVVLDGCDLSSFLEMTAALPADAGFGVVAPLVRRDGQLSADLQPLGGFGVGVALLPTVTSHSRRALFGGEIPGSIGLTETEAAAANARADHKAFEANTALHGVKKRLLLKGEVERERGLLRAMDGEEQLVAVVWNAVDDALSSKETTPFPPWSFSGLGSEALQALRVAVERDWTVLVTADHGHTPFVESGRKGKGGDHNRFSTVHVEGAERFDAGPLPESPLWLLHQMGAWLGHQHRGWHGGASLEEVAVPLAFLGRCGPGEGRVRAPEWWWHRPGTMTTTTRIGLPARPEPKLQSADSQASPANAPDWSFAAATGATMIPPQGLVRGGPVAAPVPPMPSPEGRTSSVPAWAAGIGDADVLRVMLHLGEHGAVDHQDLIALLGSDRAARRFGIRYEAWLTAVPFQVRIDVLPGGKRYVKV